MLLTKVNMVLVAISNSKVLKIDVIFVLYQVKVSVLSNVLIYLRVKIINNNILILTEMNKEDQTLWLWLVFNHVLEN